MLTRSAARRGQRKPRSPHFEPGGSQPHLAPLSRHVCSFSALQGIWSLPTDLRNAESVSTKGEFYRGGSQRSKREQQTLFTSNPNDLLYLAPDVGVAKVYAELGRNVDNERSIFRCSFMNKDAMLLNVSKRETVARMLRWAKEREPRLSFNEIQQATLMAYGVAIGRNQELLPYDVKQHANTSKKFFKTEDVVVEDEFYTTFEAALDYDGSEPSNAQVEKAIEFGLNGYCVRNSIDSVDKITHECMLRWMDDEMPGHVGFYSAQLPSLCTLSQFKFGGDEFKGGFHAEIITTCKQCTVDDAGSYSTPLDFTQALTLYRF